ncbi:MAG: hypothetical protein HFG68_14785 [Hungatella sp.]|nr:hypothetical protein [Hungatella sp.]
MRIKWKKFAVLFLAVALFGTNTISMAEEAVQSRRFSILSISGDEAYVVKGSTKEVKATAGMPLGQGSKVRTGFQTSLYVEADDDKTIKLDSNTQAEITKVSSKSLKITLKSGEIFFNVDKPLGEGEELTFDAAQTSMSIRGTSGVLNYSQNGITFYLIEGEVYWNIGNQIVSLSAGQKAALLPGSQEQLQANGMTSMYELSEVTAFEWNELSAMALEALMEQMEQIDLSAIGLDNQEAQEQAMTQIQQMKQEKQVREEAQMREQEEAQVAVGNAGGAPVRIDGGEPETRRNENRKRPGRGEANEEEPTQPSSSEQETTQEQPTQPNSSEQETTQEQPTQPSSSEQETTQEQPIQPSSSEQETTQEKPTQPSSSEQETTQEKPTQPSSSEQETTQEQPTQPSSSEQETTQEKPTQPSSSEQETTQPNNTEESTEPTSTEGSKPSTETITPTPTLFQKPLPTMVNGTPIYGYFENPSNTLYPDRPIYDYDDKGNPLYLWIGSDWGYPIYGWDSNNSPFFGWDSNGSPIYNIDDLPRVLISSP